MKRPKRGLRSWLAGWRSRLAGWLRRRRRLEGVQPACLVTLNIPGVDDSPALDAMRSKSLEILTREFQKSAVPDGLDSGFVQLPDDWGHAFRGVRWIRFEGLLAAYAWGFGGSFLEWAATVQPFLYDTLVTYKREIVVVVLHYEPA